MKLLVCYSGFELSHKLPELPDSIPTRREPGFLRAMRTGHPIDHSGNLRIVIKGYKPRGSPCGVTAAHHYFNLQKTFSGALRS